MSAKQGSPNVLRRAPLKTMIPWGQGIDNYDTCQCCTVPYAKWTDNYDYAIFAPFLATGGVSLQFSLQSSLHFKSRDLCDWLIPAFS